eukprot:7951748-Lingulodinium_polyedra.AAC.1
MPPPQELARHLQPRPPPAARKSGMGNGRGSPNVMVDALRKLAPPEMAGSPPENHRLDVTGGA